MSEIMRTIKKILIEIDVKYSCICEDDYVILDSFCLAVLIVSLENELNISIMDEIVVDISEKTYREFSEQISALVL